MKVLQNPIRSYAWGSHTALASLQRRPVPSEQPEAELWIGAHRDDPSLVCGTPLDKLIAQAPEAMLGPLESVRLGGRLPFLLKVIAAERPLSIQVHPDRDQALAGYCAETTCVLADGGDRNYRDPNHKPELLVALGRFECLVGLRPEAETLADLRCLDVDGLEGVEVALAASDLRTAVTLLLKWPQHDRERVVSDLANAAHRLPGARGPMLVELAANHPNDLGVAMTLLLNHLVLQPGEAVFVPARVPHSYLRGVGVEVMADSDNVVRGGLTTKFVDVDELLRIVSFAASRVELVPGVDAQGVKLWTVPVGDFRLRRLRGTGSDLVTLDPPGPRIALCVDGNVTVSDDHSCAELRAGAAAFGAATGGPIRVEGDGDVFLVSL